MLPLIVMCFTLAVSYPLKSMPEKKLDNHLLHLHSMQLKNIDITKFMKAVSGHLVLQKRTGQLYKLSQEQILKNDEDKDEEDENQKINGLIKLPRTQNLLLCTSNNGKFSLQFKMRRGNGANLIIYDEEHKKETKSLAVFFRDNEIWDINNAGTLISNCVFSEKPNAINTVYNVNKLENFTPIQTNSTAQILKHLGQVASNIPHRTVGLGLGILKILTGKDKNEYGENNIRNVHMYSASAFGKSRPYFIYATHDGSLVLHEDITGKKIIASTLDTIHTASIKHITFDALDMYILSYATDRSLNITSKLYPDILYKTTLKNNLINFYWGNIKGFSEPVIAMLFHNIMEHEKKSKDEEEQEKSIQSIIDFYYFMTPEDMMRKNMIGWKQNGLLPDLHIIYK